MLTLRVLDEDGLRAMYPWIKAAFPADERRPLRMMLSLMRRGLYEAVGLYDGALPVGGALCILPGDNRAILLDYLVVDQGQRERGLGSEMLRLLRTHYAGRADALLIESEHPDSAPDPDMARRRFRFYARAGAMALEFRVLLFGVDYAIFALPTGDALPQRDWSATLLDTYRQTLPPVFYATQVKLVQGYKYP